MDGKGRYTDNIFVERLWRTVKYEEVYLKAYAYAKEARRELGAYFRFYNDQRPHQALGYRTSGQSAKPVCNCCPLVSGCVTGRRLQSSSSRAGAC